jgi:hypothetical protein
MARIRGDLTEPVQTYLRDPSGYPLDPVWLQPGEEVPATAIVSADLLDGTGDPVGTEGGGAPGGSAGAPPPPADVIDPGQRTVEEVNSWLEDRPADVVAQVLAVEAAGKNRAGIMKAHQP